MLEQRKRREQRDAETKGSRGAKEMEGGGEGCGWLNKLDIKLDYELGMSF